MPDKSQSNIDKVLSNLAENEGAALERLFNFLRIPSVSTVSEFAPDCQKAAEWLAAQFEGLGFTASVRQTPGRPILVAHSDEAGPDAPRVLYYGHYDVQPADPEELWTSPAFEPVLVDGPVGKQIVARGAADDKGQVMIWIEAFRSWRAVMGKLPVRVTVLVEGEEETGSPSLKPFLKEYADELKADVAVISDGNMWDVESPSITTRLRGTVYTQIKLRTARCDLHSGLFGGVARNALNALTQLLGGLHDEQSRVQLPGFYDDVPELPDELARQWAALAFDEAALLSSFGLATPAGEVGRPALERLWSRPTADIHGIWGGYIGEGRKTVIPAEAQAKISFRVVAGQDPQRVVQCFRRFLDERRPADAQISLEVLGMEPGIEIPSDTRWMRAVRRALGDEYGKEAILGGCGGALPMVGALKGILGMDALLFSFGLDDDQVHSPNEKFELRCFRQGARAHARLLAELGRAV
ncbi:M20/M25/M40 family metallo-hydrolase [Bosea caraganae]|uniref:M20/M25/M40 family metallo-hydrolase n=2 Tax=Bosea caraganae TaxID=2763117 RepID=A0A370L297_9HYPH|nr:M20/M25/M40 family metallo-hydrolase [Bosea caraganae]RDJ28599.1 M20/M25/M40 family metallo-hydrolase [Bosea caraganae]